MDQVYEQEFISLLTYAPSNVVRVHLHSCANTLRKAWLLVHPNTFSFCLSFAYFLTTLYIYLNITHPTILHLS
jgi:hypothetical protein